MAGGLFVACAAGLRWLGVTTLNNSFSAAVETHDRHALVDSGIFAFIRHPLYLGLALLFVGLPLLAGARLTWVATILGLVGLAARIVDEEKWLTEHLEGYADYTQKTKRIIPWVW